MQKTYTPTKSELKQDWHIIDASDKILGKVAAEAATILMGKHKANYTTNINVGDKVVIINAELVAVTGNKLKGKVYNRHTGFPGGLRSETLGKKLQDKPTEVIKLAVSGMLPKNKLRKERILSMYIYKGSQHPHEAQISK